MNHRGRGKACALVFICVIIHWRRVCGAPRTSTPTMTCPVASITNMLYHEAEELLNLYVDKHYNGTVPYPDQIHADAPGSTITGANALEKLQDIYRKNEIFNLHLEKVQEYDTDIGGGELQGKLTHVKGRLSHHLDEITRLLPRPSWPPSPAPLTLTHTGSYDKKDYGRGVLVRLHQWAGNVTQVLKEICEMAPV